MSNPKAKVELTVLSHVFLGQQGTPIYVKSSNEYSGWLETQTKTVQNWLTTTNYSGKGLALIPSPDGELEFVIFFCDTDDYFCCGDLPKALPRGDYYFDDQNSQLLEKVIFGWQLGSYQYSVFKSKDDHQQPNLYINNESVLIESKRLAKAIYLTRDLINTPAENLMPQHLAYCAEQIASEFAAKVQQWVGDELLTNNYPTIHAVGRASVHPPRLIELTWGDPSAPKLSIVGKGVCFDSGGLDLKPASGMRNMKKDMGGAAHALALAYLVMANQLPVNLRLLLPAVENAVSSNAFRPGDIIKTRKGLTVEIDNTDAEGRLILCDALAEACTENPELIIDFATLTGAARVALGTELPAMFSTNKTIADEVSRAGETVGDPVWPMPLHKPYRNFINSEVADLVNSASSGFGGAITAALFLQEFVATDTDWMHFDVMAWNNRKLSGRPMGGEAMGLRAVYQYLQNRFTKGA